MADQIHFEPIFKFLICKLHGTGVHPCKSAIKRHLRGKDHRCKRTVLKHAVSTLISLSLDTLEAVLAATPNINTQPLIPPVPHLKVLSGWHCLLCEGQFLTTSLELVQRHASSTHGRRRGEKPVWRPCKLQSLFSETKDRKYFRVALSADGLDSVGSEDTRDLVPSPPSLSRSVTVWHPFTAVAKDHVHLSGCRLDYLCKSDAFRSASEPLFDGSHIDAAMNMNAVFPQGDEDPVFINALLYSTVQIMNRGVSSIEGHLLQANTIKLLNERLTDSFHTLSPATIGAIMIMKTTAYKTRDTVACDAHTDGLLSTFEIFISRKDSQKAIVQHLKRAMFWVHLYGVVLGESHRQPSYLQFHQRVDWRREDGLGSLPKGFQRLRDFLPVGLLECILDTLEFQECLRIDTVSQATLDAKYRQLDPMQASIESRLTLATQCCRKKGVIAEAIHLAVFMCCYCSWMETWNDSLIPCRLAEKLLDLLEPTLCYNSWSLGDIWSQHLDVLLWLLLTNSCVVALDQGHVEGLRSRQRKLLSGVASVWNRRGDGCLEDPAPMLQKALEDFIYIDGWVSKRWRSKEWFILELSITAYASYRKVKIQ